MKVGIIGAGTMGAGIAQAFAQTEGFTVALCDINNEFAANGKNKIADKYFIKKDDVLFQAKGSKIDVVYVDKDYERVLPSTLYFILRPNEKINPKYLQWLLKTELLLLYFEKKYKTMGTVRAVNKGDIVELRVKMPEREVQDEMAKIITSFEDEEYSTMKYLKIKRKYIEERVIENNQVIIDEE